MRYQKTAISHSEVVIACYQPSHFSHNIHNLWIHTNDMQPAYLALQRELTLFVIATESYPSGHQLIFGKYEACKVLLWLPKAHFRIHPITPGQQLVYSILKNTIVKVS